MKLIFSLPARFLLCFLSAALVWFSFPNFLAKTLTPPTAFLGWIALVPFFLALHKTTPRQGAFLGWLFGFTQFGGILYWIALLEAAQYLSGLGWFVLVFYLSLFFLAFGWLYRFWAGEGERNSWIAPFLWVALEFVRGTRPLGGFSWGELGYSQAPYPVLLTLTSLGGVYGLTFIMVRFNQQIAGWILQNLGDHPRDPQAAPRAFSWGGFFLTLSALASIFLWGTLQIKETSLRKAGTVALLQPSIDQDVKWSREYEKSIFDKLEWLVRSIRGQRPDLVVWPETAAPSYLLGYAPELKRVKEIVRMSKTSNLVGCLDSQRESNGRIRDFNAAIQFSPGGVPGGIYHKRHLVPFGEYVPFQKYLTFLGPVVGDLGNFSRGEKYELLLARGFSYTPMICYEVIFPGDVHQAFETGADALVNISNDAWYGRTASAYQHAMMAVVRAAEERKPLLRAANTGICLATDPFGRILCSTKIFEETEQTADVILATPPPSTLYARWGNWFPHLCWIVVLGFAAWVIVTARRRKTNVESAENHGP